MQATTSDFYVGAHAFVANILSTKLLSLASLSFKPQILFYVHPLTNLKRWLKYTLFIIPKHFSHGPLQAPLPLPWPRTLPSIFFH